MRRKSRDSEPERVPLTLASAHALALGWLSARDLSIAQVQQRLARRHVEADVTDQVIRKLVASGVLDESRLALSAARRETAIKGRGPARARAKLRALGLSDATAAAALDQTLASVDVDALLDRALEKRLKRAPPGALSPAATRRILGALVRQGFAPAAIFARLRRRSTEVPDDIE